MRAAVFPPVHDHTRLRKRKSQKCADGIKRDQPIRNSSKQNEQRAPHKHGQHDDAVGIDQTAPAVPEDVRQVIVLRDGPAEPRKIGESGIGGEREHEQDRAHGQVVKKAFAENGGGEHGENALISGLARIGGGDAVSLHQIGNSRQQHRQQKDNHGEGALRVFHGRLAERLHAVAHSFHAR